METKSEEKALKKGNTNKNFLQANWAKLLIGGLVTILLVVIAILLWQNFSLMHRQQQFISQYQQTSTITEEATTSDVREDSTTDEKSNEEEETKEQEEPPKTSTETKPPTKPKKKPVVKTAYGSFESSLSQSDPDYEDYAHFMLPGDYDKYPMYIYLIPKDKLNNQTLTHTKIYKITYTTAQVKEKVKKIYDTTPVEFIVLKDFEKVEETPYQYFMAGTYHRNAGDEWGVKYADDGYLDLYINVNGDEGQLVYFIPKDLVSKMGLEIGRGYRIAIQYCDDDIHDPSLQSYICSGKFHIIEVVD
jgi:hypothetical protein